MLLTKDRNWLMTKFTNSFDNESNIKIKSPIQIRNQSWQVTKTLAVDLTIHCSREREGKQDRLGSS